MIYHDAEIMVRDATTRKMVGATYYQRAASRLSGSWCYELYDGTETRVTGFMTAHEALQALTNRLCK